MVKGSKVVSQALWRGVKVIHQKEGHSTLVMPIEQR